MSSRHNSALAPDWHGDADAVAVDARYHALLELPGDELVKVLNENAKRDFERAVATAAENMYAADADNGDDE